MKPHRSKLVKKDSLLEQQLLEAFVSLQTLAEAKKFLEDLCTPTEIQAMADRWRVVDLVKAGKPYRQIYKETGVSVTTVGRVARCLMLGEGGYNIIYERLEKKKRK
jgi:TrpR-related protein YerC/YecD